MTSFRPKKSRYYRSQEHGNITRRDFVNASLVGAGAALLTAPAPLAALASGDGKKIFPPTPDLGDWWYGYGGIGDYASSHGNTPEAVSAAHSMRDGKYRSADNEIHELAESYDLIVVGAGLAGVGAAYEYRKLAGASASCLVLDNHPVFGGEAKQNEFMVNGHHLVAPQGSNGFSIPDLGNAEAEDFSAGDAYYYRELGIPTQFSYADLPAGSDNLRFGRDNYGYLFWTQDQVDVSYVFNSPTDEGPATHVLNPWSQQLTNTPYPAAVRDDLLAWRSSNQTPYQGSNFRAWLDTMTYKHYIEQELGLSAAVTEYCDPILASAVGLGCDVISAYAAFNVALPGFRGYETITIDHRHSFPGGNSGFLRHFVKKAKPEAISGGDSFAEILNNPIQFELLDQPGQQLRFRQNSTVVHVRHDNANPDSSNGVEVTYIKDGSAYRIKARAVVMATGAWVNKHVVRGLPSSYENAFARFHHAPILVANVALSNWRFIEKLGATGTLYKGGFGAFCNIRRPMHVGNVTPPLAPDSPAVMTFYVPFYYPGLSLQEQGQRGRLEMLTTPFSEYERQIRAQLTHLYGSYGFNPDKDIEAIVLNRWGHAYVTPQPGFYFGENGAPAPRDVLTRNFGRIAFAHSELKGNQHWGPAAMEGRRAISQLSHLFSAG
ncbi:NAD(P)-binding protein [Kineobactrum salinum]|uniref:FAD-dependent oxidoreductase n=1 Tax=Kineobactrum salinum TaxID=2708301 RepID=A0A6C0U4D0_9GAMM|nr:NAD(P)-binding protein [Kineobactrum salinum]QIB66788.1 FAD-dependent oxidoreductase [Kineobactrum salinum]